jgi:hypothetical protein
VQNGCDESVSYFTVWERRVINGKVMVVLQNCMDSLKVECGSDSETCHDGNQVIDIKVEEITGIQAEDDPVLITFPVIKAEDEVSCLSICNFLAHFTSIWNCQFSFSYQSIWPSL